MKSAVLALNLAALAAAVGAYVFWWMSLSEPPSFAASWENQAGVWTVLLAITSAVFVAGGFALRARGRKPRAP